MNARLRFRARWCLLAAAVAACTHSSSTPPALVDAGTPAEAALRERLQAALAAKGPTYVPRTRHKNADGTAKFTNRLILETSPYLLQHAHNPVNWYAWGDEAFATARKLGRPVFISIGYSTCHWCHVMEEESFEDEEIAQYLNDHYVAIKVDREERPDVDAVYMTFVQAVTGGGGWPMNVWTTPGREPFFGGTYFPPRAGARGATTGFIELLRKHYESYSNDPSMVAESADTVITQIEAATAPAPAADVPSAAAVLKVARTQAAQRYDPAAGGARGAPKFPSSFPTRLLLRIARRTNDSEARTMALTTLVRMRAGGIYDQIGGGFHRYSTDPRWVVPHFEKTLYDNAQLALTYLEASQVTGETRPSQTARETLDYLLRDMRAPDGTFYSATDADSLSPTGNVVEGYAFTWTIEDLVAALGSDDARRAAAWFGVTQYGNFEGRNVLTVERSVSDIAGSLSMEPAALEARLPELHAKLLVARQHRPQPLRDEKVMVAWNGLAMSAFARAAIVLGDARYAEAATKAASVLIAPVRAGRPLPHLFVAGKEQGLAFADDYVMLANGLLDVFELTSDPAWLKAATGLMEELERSFVDTANGGYFLSAARHEQLMLKEKPDYDGPVPSASSVAAGTWLRLYALTDDDKYRQRADATMRAFSSSLLKRPLGLERMAMALEAASDSPKEIVVVVPEGRGALEGTARPLLDLLQRRFVPNAALVVATEAELNGALGAVVPWAKDKVLRAGKVTAYVCEQGSCKLPTSDPAVFATQLAETRPYP